MYAYPFNGEHVTQYRTYPSRNLGLEGRTVKTLSICVCWPKPRSSSLGGREVFNDQLLQTDIPNHVTWPYACPTWRHHGRITDHWSADGRHLRHFYHRSPRHLMATAEIDSLANDSGQVTGSGRLDIGQWHWMAHIGLNVCLMLTFILRVQVVIDAITWWLWCQVSIKEVRVCGGVPVTDVISTSVSAIQYTSPWMNGCFECKMLLADQLTINSELMTQKRCKFEYIGTLLEKRMTVAMETVNWNKI